MRLAAAVLVLLVAACSASEPEAPQQPAWPPAIDRQNRATWYDRPIDASGSDPALWRAEVRREAITVTPPNGAAALTFPRSPARLTADAGIYNSVASDGTTLQLSLRNRWCQFRHTDPLQPFTVEIDLVRPGGPGSMTLRGCGAQVGYGGARSAG